MVTVQALMSFAFSVSGPFLPLYIIQLGVKPIAAVSAWAGAVASINFLAAAIFSPVWGGIADRTGRKAMVVRSVPRDRGLYRADGFRAERLAALCRARLHGDLQRLLCCRHRDGRHASTRREPRVFAGLDDDRSTRRRTLRSTLRRISRRPSAGLPPRFLRDVALRAGCGVGLHRLRSGAVQT